MRTVSLPMYRFPETASHNAALWGWLRERLGERGVETSRISFDTARRAVPDGIGSEIFLTQVCGYPLFNVFEGQGRILAAPVYDIPGCEGATHRAFFMVRANDPVNRLADLRERVFGCNSVLSNSGMNLPRLSLARLAGARPFFSSVVMTGGHLASLERLDAGDIDLCSIDNVTWGLFARYRPHDAQRFRVLAETVSSPSLPFVTSTRTGDLEAEALEAALYAFAIDPLTIDIRESTFLRGFAPADRKAYVRLAEYEREAAELGYPVIR